MTGDRMRADLEEEVVILARGLRRNALDLGTAVRRRRDVMDQADEALSDSVETCGRDCSELPTSFMQVSRAGVFTFAAVFVLTALVILSTPGHVRRDD